jgi:Uma2 family endonuclease
MITTSSPPVVTPPIGEKRVTFHHLNWQAYQQILHAVGESRSARLTYDQGILEITMPLEEHEFAARLIELLIRVLVVELGLKIKTMGSTTLIREDLDRSPEPDNAYYIQNQSQVAGKKVNLATDPPPDLVVEIDITHTDIDKLRLYASLGVPEFWRFDGQVWRIYQLDAGQYQEVECSPTFPLVPKQRFYDFLQQAQQDEVEAEQHFRAWVREQL